MFTLTTHPPLHLNGFLLSCPCKQSAHRDRLPLCGQPADVSSHPEKKNITLKASSIDCYNSWNQYCSDWWEGELALGEEEVTQSNTSGPSSKKNKIMMPLTWFKQCRFISFSSSSLHAVSPDNNSFQGAFFIAAADCFFFQAKMIYYI